MLELDDIIEAKKKFYSDPMLKILPGFIKEWYKAIRIAKLEDKYTKRLGTEVSFFEITRFFQLYSKIENNTNQKAKPEGREFSRLEMKRVRSDTIIIGITLIDDKRELIIKLDKGADIEIIDKIYDTSRDGYQTYYYSDHMKIESEHVKDAYLNAMEEYLKAYLNTDINYRKRK